MSDTKAIYVWGSTVNGELGLGGIEEEHIYSPILLKWPESKNVIEIATGESHTLLLTIDGKVSSCGSNDYGQLGHDKPRKRPQPVQKLDAYEISSIACGAAHSMTLNKWGQLFTFGCNKYGQLGHPSGTASLVDPKLVKSLANYQIVQIAAGQWHSVALTNSGDILTWGSNSHGQLGIGSSGNSVNNPTIVTSLSGIPIGFIACGGRHTFAVSKSGAVFGWGKNDCGQLGLNDTTNKLYPTQLRTLRNIRVCYISCGEDFSAFLSKEGGVFTCGAGSYGQLGHGGTSNEILPRKVSELMGSTITQIQCGRQHTLALVPSRGRIYSFGLGGAGQLGRQKTGNISTPQLVVGPWISGSSTSLNTNSGPATVNVYRIFSGGDHCFAQAFDISDDSILPYDCRIFKQESQVLAISYEKLKEFARLDEHAKVDQETIAYLETACKSLACFNGSFLLDNDEHYYCSSKHHGVNLALAEKTFNLIGKLENHTIKQIIFNSITEDLLKKLTASPPDVEALRIYLVLPFYHEFNNPKKNLILHKPFAKSLLSLKVQANRVIGSWWSMLSVDYFEKLVQIFKSVATHIIATQRVAPQETVRHDDSLVSMLRLLELLNRLNHSVDGLKVPYDTFHINDLTDYLDVRIDYICWLTDSSNTLYLCNFPFIFDAQAKTQLLLTDQSIQMENAMHAAAQQALISMLLGPTSPHALNRFLVLRVSREHIVQDAIRELGDASASDLKKPLKVKFHDEEAEDAGGVRKEFFLLLLREILDPKYGMFKEYEETRAIWFSEDSFEDEMMYFFIGQICGLAIYNFTIIDIPFPLALYKKLLNEPVILADVKGLSPTIANSLQSLLDFNESDIEEVFGLTFEVTRESYGQVRSIPLKENGEKIRVTQENKKEYVDLYVDYIFNTSVKAHYDAFCKGFLKVCGGRVLELFHSHELMAVVIGNENYDWHALEENADYKNGYKSSDQVIRWFWEVLHEMSLSDKKKFLLYLTGSDRIPIQGMKAIKIIIQPTNDEKYLPVAHTCFNLLDLPKYGTKERLKYKLMQAIQQTQGFSLV